MVLWLVMIVTYNCYHLINEKIIVFLTRRIYDYILGLVYVKKTPNAQSIFLCKPDMVSLATGHFFDEIVKQHFILFFGNP